MKAKKQKPWYPKESRRSGSLLSLLMSPDTAPSHFSALLQARATDPARDLGDEGSAPRAEAPREGGVVPAGEAGFVFIYVDGGPVVALPAAQVRRW